MNGEITSSLLGFAERHQEILGVFLFGSHARDRARPASDVDVALFIDAAGFDPTDGLRRQMQYAVELEGLLHKPVDVVILNQAPPVLRHQVFRKGKLIFERDGIRVRRFIGDALVQFYDEIVMLEAAQNAMIRRHLLGR